MGRLIIRQVVYKGTNYSYVSPEFDTGVQIVEGENGKGKSTFSALICFGLGIYVKQFDPKEVEQHEEIMTDENNFVELVIQIDRKRYTLKRFFKETSRNYIFVDGEGKSEKFVLNRNTGEAVFSDWILEKLGIEVCDIYQGSRNFKIQFSDLFRLIHYDQETATDKIYKEHRSSGNFLVDSLAMRKIIFELLVGYTFSEFYALVGKRNHAERVKESYKLTLDNYLEMVGAIGYDINAKTLKEIQLDIKKGKEQLHVLEFQRNQIKISDPATIPQMANKYASTLASIEERIVEKRTQWKNVSRELNNVEVIKRTTKYEIEQIYKIILTSKELNLFSIDTCPCCLRKTSPPEGSCICGEPLEEGMYERFFYDSDEYLDILKTKQKSLKTIDVAIQSCEVELSELERTIDKLNNWKIKVRLQLEQLKDAEHNDPAILEVKELGDKILEISKTIADLEQREVVVSKYAKLTSDYTSAKQEYDKFRNEVDNQEKEIRKLISKQIKAFNTIYNTLMTEADETATSAEIDDDTYMPVINKGVYRASSKNVAKRLLYYFTLLQLSLESSIVAYPRFQLIDTPETLGIDKEPLLNCLSQLENIDINKGKDKFQVILTTGIGKLPDSFRERVRVRLTDSPLLQPRHESKKSDT